MKKENIFNGEVSIVLCGEAGQGIKTIELILVNVLKEAGFNIFATKEYMSRIRGGSNSTSIRVSGKKVRAMVERVDILIPLDEKAIGHLSDRITRDTIIIGDGEILKTDREIIDMPLMRTAREIGNAIYANVVACGVIFSLFGMEPDILKNYLKSRFRDKGEEVVNSNFSAADRGYELGSDLYSKGTVKIEIKTDPGIREEYFLDGTDAIGFGALFGGCNFISSYPMSPSTGVLTFLSEHSKEMEIVVEQAEDEISAVNMCLGAWYAGARAMATTSGGGFALMGEGLSLAGITETPAVIMIAQRPGPATGLPTRTEQGDLEVALYSGHGEFPRIILSITDLETAMETTARAFDMADKFQVPVIILADQYTVDSYYNFMPANNEYKIETHFIKTDASYKRYRLTSDGISPRGIPGFGDGFVRVDSDEHDEDGRITEDLDLRIKMMDKRLEKASLIEKEIIAPAFYGGKNYETLVIGWGSTRNVISEAIGLTGDAGTAHLHFTQVNPLDPSIVRYLAAAKKTVIVENNATGQFAKLIRQTTGIEIEHKILKYNGLQFYVEELAGKLKKIIGE